jgi:hypothetical protein
MLLDETNQVYYREITSEGSPLTALWPTGKPADGPPRVGLTEVSDRQAILEKRVVPVGGRFRRGEVRGRCESDKVGDGLGR